MSASFLVMSTQRRLVQLQVADAFSPEADRSRQVGIGDVGVSLARHKGCLVATRLPLSAVLSSGTVLGVY